MLGNLHVANSIAGVHFLVRCLSPFANEFFTDHEHELRLAAWS